jgi:SAM-dependent methyltransferase
MLKKALDQGQPGRDGLYGLQWGDPDHYPPLVPIRDHWVLPHVRPDRTALEIGPGGGRWTRYLLPFKQLYVVDYHAELLAELRKNFVHPNIIEILNNGTDFPGVPPRSVDFVFSFGCFVHFCDPGRDSGPILDIELQRGLKAAYAKPYRNPFAFPRILPRARARSGGVLAARAEERPHASLHQCGHGAVQERLHRPGEARLFPRYHRAEMRARGRQAQ